MSHYPITWITDCLAVGHAPMSYAELDSVREQGISAIVNLCGEYSDLHKIEENAGFEVFYLPIPDETAPAMDEMEKGLEWLDEAIYLRKKVLIHCKHGVGRTGTFVTAYMLRRGFNLKNAWKLLKKTRANPTNYSQWWLLRKYGKKEGQLKIDEPSAENRSSADLSDIYARYEQLLNKIDSKITNKSPEYYDNNGCEYSTSFHLSPIEALYLNSKINNALSSDQRNKVIEKAAGTMNPSDCNKTSKEPIKKPIEVESSFTFQEQANPKCPLFQDNECLLHQYRPVHCRCNSSETDTLDLQEINKELTLLSEQILTTLFGEENVKNNALPKVNSKETISGKFIQRYFHYLASQKSGNVKEED